MSRKIVITSGKGGVGKTTVTVNLGRALASFGERVLLIDIDFGLNNLDVVLGLENKVVYDIFDIFEGRCRIRQAIINDDKYKNLSMISSGSRIDGAINSQNLRVIIDNIEGLYDFILLDCPAGIDAGFHRAISCADEAIIVTTPTLTSVRDADKVSTILRSYKLDKVSIIVNRARGDLIVNGKTLLPYDIKNILKTNLIGVLPEEDEVFLSTGYALSKTSDTYKAYKLLAENVRKEKNKIYDVTQKYCGFIGSIRRAIKRNI